MSELLFEIFSEEIPARMQAAAERNFTELSTKELERASVIFKSLRTFITPRRLVLVVEGLKLSKADKEEVLYKKGPRVSEKAEVIEAFAKSLHLKTDNLITRDIKDEKYFFAKLTKVQESLEVILKKTLERILQEFSWPKSMKWDDSNVKWVRPIRSLLCVLNKKILPVSYGNLVASDVSFGHRFLAPKAFKVKSFKDYAISLAKGKVILDREERKKEIQKQIAEKKIKVVQDEGLLEEVAGLVEYPQVLIGEMDKQFLDLPREIIVSTVRTHQKYFVVEDEGGNLAPYFVIVSNIVPKDKGKVIIEGNERVLRARLKDAQFFFDADRQTTLESKVDHLRRQVFHEKLGTMFGKAQAMVKIVEKLIELGFVQVNVEMARRAAVLAKADLTTNLVNEFPELQGVIGMYYAQLDGEDAIVSRAICDHYLPRGKEEIYPSSMEGALVAIADKIYTLVGLFLAGEIPTSSKDPYSLRRQALGIIKMLYHFKLDLNIFKLVSYTADIYEKEDIRKIIAQINDFLYNRFKFWLKDKFKHDLIDAVMACTSGNIYADYRKLVALTEFLDTNEGKELFLSIKRVIHIAGSQSKEVVKLNEKLFNKWEKKLFETLSKVERKVGSLLREHRYDEILVFISQMTPIINDFFDHVLVMDKDQRVRANRLVLLHKVSKLFGVFADFSCVEM